ncbi:hypothetical protein HK405_011363, partial [Cladochytrium tenue]
MPSPRRRSKKEKKNAATAPAAAKTAVIGDTLVRIVDQIGASPASTTNEGTFSATAGFEDAVRRCKEKVDYISRVCRARNAHFRDPYFDLMRNKEDCIDSLVKDDDDESYEPQGSRRIRKIFNNPKFFVDGINPGDIMQGKMGDCWFLAACATLSNKQELLKRIMVARDEEVGVYGFVFFRDGQWVSTIVDDQLFVNFPDYGSYALNKEVKERDYNATFMSNSGALYFSKCRDENETWLPLLEKAFAKVHGDYQAISGGFGGEAVEDLTGGVCSYVALDDILDTDRFWREELSRVNQDRLFFCDLVGRESTKNLISGHEYSILKAVEVKGRRFLLIRNPWGKSEWNGPWGDGSAEWTPEWLQLLDHRFGNDGMFWMEYCDFLKEWFQIGRAILFDDTWSLSRQFLQIQASLPATFSNFVFEFDVERDGPAYIVLSQGRYDYKLTFRVMKVVSEDDPLDPTKKREQEIFFSQPVRSLFGSLERSIFVELESLPKGRYRVYPKVYASIARSMTRNQVIQAASVRVEKMERVMESYLLAVAKAAAERVLAKKRAQKLAEAVKSKGDAEDSKQEETKQSAKSSGKKAPSGVTEAADGAGKATKETKDLKAKPEEDGTGGDGNGDGDDDGWEDENDGEENAAAGEGEEENDEEEEAEDDEEEEDDSFEDLTCSLLLRVYAKDPSLKLSTNMVPTVDEILMAASGGGKQEQEQRQKQLDRRALLKPDAADPNGDLKDLYDALVMSGGAGPSKTT